MATTLSFVRRVAAVVLLAVLLLCALPAPFSRALPSPLTVPFAVTNGNVLASAVLPVQGAQALAVTGNFTTVTGKDGVVHAARNFAVLAVPSGRLIFTAPLNGYGRAVHYARNRLYLGGDFTTAAGYPRNHLASFSTLSWGLSGFNPPNTSRVYALSYSPLRNRVLIGTSTSVFTTPPDTAGIGQRILAAYGPVRALLLYPSMYPGVDVMYVGGLFEKLGSLQQHGLARLLLHDTGITIDRVFAPRLRPDSGVGPRGGDDGQAVLSLAAKLPDMPLLVGWGGASTNGVMALNQETGAVWWTHGTGTTPGTPGDAQAVAALPTAVRVGYHRNHGNDTDEPWPWYGAALEPSFGGFLTWDPRLTGLTSANIGESNPGGITTFSVDRVNRLLFAGGGFRWAGADCPGTVYPCVNERAVPSQSIAMFRW